MNGKHKISHQGKLAAIFEFTAEELTVNRDGYLSEPQQLDLRAQLRAEIEQELLLGSYLLLGFFILMFVGSEVAIYGSLILLAIGGIAFSVAGRTTFKRWCDLQADFVAVAEGQLLTEQVKHPFGWRTVMYVGGERFEVSERKLITLIPDDRYRVYYLPHSRTIFSVEWLNTDPFE